MHKQYSAIIALTATMLVCSASLAAPFTDFYDNESDWLAAVINVEVLTTNAASIALATEVAAPPVPDQQLGATLTFDSANTGLSQSFQIEALQSGAGFTFADAGHAAFVNALSVGSLDVYEDDDWQLLILPGSRQVFAFGFILGDSHRGAGEHFNVYDVHDNLLGSSSNIPAGPTASQFFLGVVTSSPIGRIEFDEGPGDDDISVADLRFAEVPEPATLSLMAMGGLALLRKRRECLR